MHQHHNPFPQLPSKRTAILPVVPPSTWQHDQEKKKRIRIRNQASKCSQQRYILTTRTKKEARTRMWLRTLVPAPGSRTAHRAHVKESLSPTPPTPLEQTVDRKRKVQCAILSYCIHSSTTTVRQHSHWSLLSGSSGCQLPPKRHL